jgi:hypothetical protein
MFCALGLIFGLTECVGSRFHILRTQTFCRRYRGRGVPFSYFARPNSFSAVSRTSGPVFMFCALRLFFGGAECDGSRFRVLRARNHFRWYRGRLVPFSCFVLPNSFSGVPRASHPVFMFCAPRLIFGGAKDVGSRFHVLRSRTRFQRYRGCQSHFHILRGRTYFRRYRVCPVPFSCFVRPNSFWAKPRASGPLFMF